MKNVELEVVNNNNKATKKVDLFGGDSGFGKRDAQGFSGGGEEEEVKGKDGLRFRDLGGMEGVVEELKMEVIVPLYHPQLPRWLGVRPMAGILLHGRWGVELNWLMPLLMRPEFHSIRFQLLNWSLVFQGPELLNKHVGGSELAVRTIFSCARTCSPCILFFDEVDALTTKRGKEGGWIVERLLNQICGDGPRCLTAWKVWETTVCPSPESR